MDFDEKVKKLQDLIDNSKRIVFFGGAGVSTESGIPDFRSEDGLYHQKYKFPPEVILSHSFFVSNTAAFYEFYRDKMLITNVSPNITHNYLAKLEKTNRLSRIVTQNIDGLHTLAGNKKVSELHGSIHRNYCTKCGRFYGIDVITSSNDIPRCECGGIIKPDVVLYEESLNPKTIEETVLSISQADLLIVAGTSLSVYPAAGFLDYFNGDNLVLINKSATQYDQSASLLINEGLGDVFGKLNIPASI